MLLKEQGVRAVERVRARREDGRMYAPYPMQNS